MSLLLPNSGKFVTQMQSSIRSKKREYTLLSVLGLPGPFSHVAGISFCVMYIDGSGVTSILIFGNLPKQLNSASFFIFIIKITLKYKLCTRTLGSIRFDDRRTITSVVGEP
jgi:hypothetical protein